jgi:DNA-binding IclR family transcriptional regulator
MSREDDATEVKARDGNQTLARGLRAMLAISDNGGMSVQQLGEMLGVHRSIAYRIVQTLADFGLATRNSEGLWVPGARMATFADAYLPALRDVAQPIMRQLADKLQSTVLLFIEQADAAQAVTIVEPTTASYHIAFRPGMRTPLDRGASGYALLASRPAFPDEPSAVTLAREDGFARSHGEVRSGAYAVAAWVTADEPHVRACLTVVTYTAEIAEKAGPDIRRAADNVGRQLSRAHRTTG